MNTSQMLLPNELLEPLGRGAVGKLLYIATKPANMSAMYSACLQAFYATAYKLPQLPSLLVVSVTLNACTSKTDWIWKI